MGPATWKRLAESSLGVRQLGSEERQATYAHGPHMSVDVAWPASPRMPAAPRGDGRNPPPGVPTSVHERPDQGSAAGDGGARRRHPGTGHDDRVQGLVHQVGALASDP